MDLAIEHAKMFDSPQRYGPLIPVLEKIKAEQVSVPLNFEGNTFYSIPRVRIDLRPRPLNQNNAAPSGDHSARPPKRRRVAQNTVNANSGNEEINELGSFSLWNFY